MDWQTILALISSAGTLISIIVAVRTSKAQARATEATAKKTDVEAQDRIIENLRAGYDRLCEENATLRARIDTLTGEYDELTARYKQLKADYDELLIWARLRGWPCGVQR